MAEVDVKQSMLKSVQYREHEGFLKKRLTFLLCKI